MFSIKEMRFEYRINLQNVCTYDYEECIRAIQNHVRKLEDGAEK